MVESAVPTALPTDPRRTGRLGLAGMLSMAPHSQTEARVE
jgi:hypothetical protein